MKALKVKGVKTTIRILNLKDRGLKILISSTKWAMGALFICFLSTVIYTGSAYALCAAQEETGEWIALANTNNLDVAEITIRLQCNDVCHNGHCEPSGLFMSISDGTYDSHEFSLQRLTLSSGDWLYGVYDNGWATTYIYAKMSSLNSEQLYVTMYTEVHCWNCAGPEGWRNAYFIRQVESCIDSCGTKAPGGCWCDSLCSYYGDCCADKVDQCGS